MSVTRADELDALAERVEKLTGAHREVDAEITVATFVTIATDDDLIYARRRDPGHDATHPGHYFIKSRSGATAQSAPLYTFSLDAAMSLVPEGWFGSVPINRNCDAWLRENNQSKLIYGKGSTPALALTAACLRAQASIIREARR